MQTTTPAFEDLANGNIRPLSWSLKASFDKSFDPGVGFFTLSDGVTPMSLLDGPDILSSDDSDVVQEWDKYLYKDYSDRVISIEITQEQIEPYSVVQSIADVTLNNFDNYFTPLSGSPIDEYILPRRPMRLLLGFNGENLPQFIGLTDSVPKIDRSARTASFHLIDFLTYIFDREIGETQLLSNVSTGDILDVLFQSVGLLPGQYILDETSFNRVDWFFVEQGQKLGEIVHDLMQAEQGRLYMDELGIIRFQNRQSYDITPVWSFDKTNTIDYTPSTEDDIINYAKVDLEVLAEYEDVSLWSQSEAIYIPAGQTKEVIASLENPASSVDDPIYHASEVSESRYTTSVDIEGNIPYLDIDLASIDKYAKLVKMTFENTGTTNGYITQLELWGNSIRVVDAVDVEEFDQDSIDKFEERRYEFTTRYIQSINSAISKVSIIVDDYKDYGSILDISVKGTPALQINDVVTLDLDGFQGDFTIMKIVQILGNGRYQQQLKVKFKEPRTYFILSSDIEARSLLDGVDVLTP